MSSEWLNVATLICCLVTFVTNSHFEENPKRKKCMLWFLIPTLILKCWRPVSFLFADRNYKHQRCLPIYVHQGSRDYKKYSPEPHCWSPNISYPWTLILKHWSLQCSRSVRHQEVENNDIATKTLTISAWLRLAISHLKTLWWIFCLVLI